MPDLGSLLRELSESGCWTRAACGAALLGKYDPLDIRDCTFDLV
jgi:hypothetical protein